MKNALKTTIHSVSQIIVAPLYMCFLVSSLMLGRDRALEAASQSLAVLPGLWGMFLRRAFLSIVLKRCHRTSEIGFGTLFSQCTAIIDENVYVGPNCHLGLVHLERDVLIAAGVHIPSGGQTHFFDDPDTPIKDQGGARELVTIGAGAWIGSGAIIMANVGKGTVVGAGSVVTKPLPENVIAAGVPAKVIRARFQGE